VISFFLSIELNGRFCGISTVNNQGVIFAWDQLLLTNGVGALASDVLAIMGCCLQSNGLEFMSLRVCESIDALRASSGVGRTVEA
jgi:hypothetical protein